MTVERSFAKTLSANDVGATGSHQAGILVPKSDPELLAFFPQLDSSRLNPDAWITCVDGEGTQWKFRYIHYNNRLHTERGTRNEYRLTCMTPFLRRAQVRQGDQLVFTATASSHRYLLSITAAASGRPATPGTPGVIRLAGWRRVH